jgi:hypothetical protein
MIRKKISDLIFCVFVSILFATVVILYERNFGNPSNEARQEHLRILENLANVRENQASIKIQVNEIISEIRARNVGTCGSTNK